MTTRPSATSTVAAAILTMVIALLVAGCTSSGPDSDRDTAGLATPEPDSTGDRLYTATWTVNAEAVGKEGPGYPYQYVEIIDDANGVFLMQGPQHLALQTTEKVVFCAGTDQVDARCASTTRPRNNPNVLSLGLAAIRDWHPKAIYEVADYRRLKLTTESDPTQWTSSRDVAAGIPVECFSSGQSATTPEGLRICYTDDDNRLLASVDMNGDFINELELGRYDPWADEDALELDYEVADDEKRFEQLIVIFPEVPITPTPVPVDEDGQPIPPTAVAEAEIEEG